MSLEHINMLKQLDVLIGFAVVMSVVSLLITILTQMISSLLGLRGANLADALQAMILKIDPKFDQDFKNLAKKLADDVLTHPTISDSALSMTKDRGRLERVFMMWKRASAIRPDEFLGLVRHLAGVKAGELVSAVSLDGKKGLAEAAEKAEAAAKAAVISASGSARRAVLIDAKARAKDAQKAHAAYAAAKLLFALQPSDKADEIDNLKATISKFAGSYFEQDKTRLEQLEKEMTDKISDNVEQWFNSAGDRAKQWFATHLRCWTVIFAFVMAFVLQLDTFSLFNSLSTDSELRGKLVNYSQNTLAKKADEVFSNTLSLSAMNRQALHSLQSSIDAPDSLKTNAGLTNIPTETTADLENWLAGAAGTNSSNAIKEFHKIQQRVAKTNYDDASKDFAELSDSVSKTGFQLMPDPYPPIFAEPVDLCGWPWQWEVMSGHWSWPKRRLLGILASAALLSLGAPFWFNALKSLANLRPALAKQIGQEEEAAKES